MKSPAHAWFPSGTLTSARVAGPVTQAIDAWSERWLSGECWRGTRAFAPAVANDWSLLRQGEASDLTGRPNAVHDLAFAMLGARPRSDLTTADAKLLRRVAGAALDDLHLAVEAACASTGTAGPRWQLTIGRGGEQVLAVDMAEEALGKLARKTSAPLSRRLPLTPRRAAAADEQVSCGAILGRATLLVEEFGALEQGDIILLDQPVADIVPLAVAGARSDLRLSLTERRNSPNPQD